MPDPDSHKAAPTLGRKPSILTRPRKKPEGLTRPESDPYLGDRAPEMAVYHFRTQKPADFAARYRILRKVRVTLDDGNISDRFLARRPNILCVKSADTIVPASDECRLRELLGLAPH